MAQPQIWKVLYSKEILRIYRPHVFKLKAPHCALCLLLLEKNFEPRYMCIWDGGGGKCVLVQEISIVVLATFDSLSLYLSIQPSTANTKQNKPTHISFEFFSKPFIFPHSTVEKKKGAKEFSNSLQFSHYLMNHPFEMDLFTRLHIGLIWRIQ